MFYDFKKTKVSKIASALKTYLDRRTEAYTCVVHTFGVYRGGRGVGCMYYASKNIGKRKGQPKLTYLCRVGSYLVALVVLALVKDDARDCEVNRVINCTNVGLRQFEILPQLRDLSNVARVDADQHTRLNCTVER